MGKRGAKLKCTCELDTCFTCRTRKTNQRFIALHPNNWMKYSRSASIRAKHEANEAAELEKKMTEKFQREGWEKR